MKFALRAMVGTSSLVVPIALGAYHASERGDYQFGTRFHTVWLLAYGCLFMLAAFVVGVPSLIVRFRQAVLGALLATSVPLGIASVFFVVYDPLIPRFIVVATPVLLFVIFFACSITYVLVTNRSESTDLVIVVLDSDELLNLEQSFAGSREKQFKIVEMLDTSSFTTISEGVLFDRISRAQANLIVLSEASQMNPVVVEHAAHFHERGIRVRSLAAFYDEWLGKLPISELRRTGMWFDIRDLHERFYPRLKRLMDIVIAIAIAPLLAMLIPIVALGNRFGNRGPVFFSQERVGHLGDSFRIHKFRTMAPTTGETGEGLWTLENDPRITPFGNFLRRSHLDELPQILNVLRGDLSIVGPRPEQSHYVRTLTETIPFYGLRHAVRPGVTGWAQVKYPYGSTVEDAIEKLQYDLYYLRHQSLALDARVCVRTLSSIIFGQGR